MGRATRRAAACAVAVLLAGGLQSSFANAATTTRIDLTVLVISDGGPATAAIAAELASQGTPYKIVNLNDANRPVIDAAFLSDTVNGQPRAKFQGVVLPNDNPFAAGSAEMTALAAFEAAFGIRQVDAYTYARPDVGLNWAQNPGYIGSLDGAQGQVTTTGLAGPFGYLKGSVPFEDNDPNIGESYGYLATPLAGADFKPLVEAPIPGTTERGSLVGEYTHDGRKELVVTFVYNQYQQQYRLLARGMVDWVTQGIHLGYDRNYFAAHVDDVFLADDRWDTTLKCTPGDVTCPPGTPESTNPIRMTPADAQYAKQWQIDHNFTMDMVFNGGGSEDWKADHEVTADPVVDQMVTDQASYRWINHTYTHPYLGCLQDVSVVPWKCTKDAGGNTVWVDQATITGQIKNNLDWAAAHHITLDKSELVTGEHSGLLTAPQETSDNPYLAPSLVTNGVKWTASDASRESGQRAVGSSTLTVPRYPMNVFYNAGTAVEETDEYNWIYTSVANGGSGVCENNANSTCLTTPLNTSTGYTSYIVPLEARIDLGHVLNNDPRPHFIHQSNLAEGRIVYPVLDTVLSTYRNLYADNAPIVNLPQREIGAEFQRRAAWNTALAAGQITAYRIGDTVTVNAPAGLASEATMPTGTVQKLTFGSTAFGTAYAGTLSGWVKAGSLQSTVTLKLTAAQTPAAPAAAAAAAAKTAPVTAPAAKTVVPNGAATAVPVGPSDTDRTDAATLVPGSGKPVLGKALLGKAGNNTAGKPAAGKSTAKKPAGKSGKQ
ncbi:hypothetical protein OG689_22005 [Kitasatospora sp. NBC_00240]|uniref:hypothetical protein n=1 Tax=Kitasatospora sp. NBC_00240 TaxID=2903567 RepID=UPI002254C54B|nr:hypothetical protein [Kitasatospora sp. NBC_00240]MCX5211923.1 hypothetical protein [Kitasatospora sp. NBC_00240]